MSNTPPYVVSRATEVLELADAAGLTPDGWQADILEGALGLTVGGDWSAPEVGVIVARQNGKGGILTMRTLAGIFLFGEKEITHSAHRWDTAKDAMKRLRIAIDTAGLSRWIRKEIRTHGEEGFDLRDPAGGDDIVVRFKTRTPQGGRGLGGELVILDEAFNLSGDQHAALMPTVTARPRWQVWYTSTPGDRDIAPCEILANVRERGQASDDLLAFYEWSVPYDDQSRILVDPADPGSWAMANPALGTRISYRTLLSLSRSMPRSKFMREVLCVGRWPLPDGKTDVVPEHRWNLAADRRSRISSNRVFSFEVARSRATASIGVAGRRKDGLVHGEVVDMRAGTAWIPKRLVQLLKKWPCKGIVIGGGATTTSLLPKIEERLKRAGLSPEIVVLPAAGVAAACGRFHDLVMQDTDDEPAEPDPQLRHIGQSQLWNAVRAAKQRSTGKSWIYEPVEPNDDITPLMSVVFAARGVELLADVEYDVLESFY